MGQCSEFLLDLLIGIEERLLLYVDKVRFRSVCVSWNSYPPKIKMPSSNNNNNQVMQFPWLLHSITQDKKTTTAEAEASHGLFCPLERKVYHLDLPDALGMFFKGSSYGWVVMIGDTITGTGPSMHLINPLTRARIQLPPRSKFPDVIDYHSDKIGTESEYTIRVPDRDIDIDYDTSADHVNLYLLFKVVLSSSPISDGCVLVAIYGECGRLAYCRRNDEEWTFLCAKPRRSFTDIIFHKGKLHALNTRGELLVFENIGPEPKVTQIARSAPHGVSPQYLVECCDGELIMVDRDEDSNGNDIFRVYKLDPNNSSWFQVYSIGDDMLFLGWSSSLAVSSHDFPGYKGNRIFFGDDNNAFELRFKEKGVNIGVFDLDDGSTESLPGYIHDPKLVWPPPLWITPSTF